MVRKGSIVTIEWRRSSDGRPCDGVETALGAVTETTGSSGTGAGGGEPEQDEGGNGAMIGLGIAAALAALGGGFVLMRRRATVDERE